MNVEIYVCDNTQALAQTLGELSGRAEIIYASPDQQGQTGEIIRYFVHPPRSAGATLDSFAGKLLVIARRG